MNYQNQKYQENNHNLDDFQFVVSHKVDKKITDKLKNQINQIYQQDKYIEKTPPKQVTHNRTLSEMTTEQKPRDNDFTMKMIEFLQKQKLELQSFCNQQSRFLKFYKELDDKLSNSQNSKIKETFQQNQELNKQLQQKDQQLRQYIQQDSLISEYIANFQKENKALQIQMKIKNK